MAGGRGSRRASRLPWSAVGCLTRDPDTASSTGVQVTAMISSDGERVPLCRTFNPKSAAGAVERWLMDCEEIMRDTVASVIKESFVAYAAKQRSDWILDWPAQVVLCTGTLYWTQEVRCLPLFDTGMHCDDTARDRDTCNKRRWRQMCARTLLCLACIAMTQPVTGTADVRPDFTLPGM